MIKPVTIAVLCTLLAGILAIPMLLPRYTAEERNKAVGILVEYPEVRVLAASTGRSVEQVFAELRAAGVTGVVIYEDTVEDWLRRGWLSGDPQTGEWTVMPAQAERLLSCLTGKFGWALGPAKAGQARLRADDKVVELPRNLVDLGTAGLGIDPIVVQRVKAVGLSPVARVANYLGATDAGIRWTLDQVEKADCEAVLFLGTEVLGQREAIDITADILRSSDLAWVYVEFGKQAGDAKLLNQLVDPEDGKPVGKVLRLHSVLPAEMTTMTPAAIVERYVRAARERGCKLLYVRMVSLAGQDPVRSNAETIRRVAEGLRRVGMDAKPARPMQPLPHNPMRGGLAVIAPLLATLAVVATLRWPLWLALLGPLPGLVADAVGFGPEHALHALVVALAFPTALTLAAYDLAERLKPTSTVVAFFVVGLLGISGALSIAGMLATLPYMLKASNFMGVKVAHVVPVLVVGGVLTLRMFRERTFDYPVRWWQLTLMLFGVVLLALLVVRTGNELAPVSALELRMRSLLDQVLPIRPRTKEVFFGHPILLAAMLAVASRRTRFAPLLFACGAVGQASVLNTFCHIHTPLSVSLARALWGIGLGGILGVVAYWVAVPVGLWIGRVWNRSWSSQGTSGAET